MPTVDEDTKPRGRRRDVLADGYRGNDLFTLSKEERTNEIPNNRPDCIGNFADSVGVHVRAVYPQHGRLFGQFDWLVVAQNAGCLVRRQQTARVALGPGRDLVRYSKLAAAVLDARRPVRACRSVRRDSCQSNLAPLCVNVPCLGRSCHRTRGQLFMKDAARIVRELESGGRCRPNVAKWTPRSQY
jgi:hypothetical protein